MELYLYLLEIVVEGSSEVAGSGRKGHLIPLYAVDETDAMSKAVLESQLWAKRNHVTQPAQFRVQHFPHGFQAFHDRLPGRVQIPE
jgi:hypothetical protein